MHARRIRNRRGSTFVLCELSKRDPSFARYPRLPVLRCPGHVPAGTTARDEPEDEA